MQIEDWNSRWQNNKIGFHQSTPNIRLTQLIEAYNLNKGASIFVPCSGKSVDVAWLAAQGYQVFANECSEKAVNDFFIEQNIDFKYELIDDFKVYHAQNITIFQGDFFNLSLKHIPQCDLIYDRASIVAFEASKRDGYVKQLSKWFHANTQMLLVTLSYDQEIMNGPPFSVPDDETMSHYSDRTIQIQVKEDIIDEGPRWRQSGLNSFVETVFKIT